MSHALPPAELGVELAAMFQLLGPLYRRVARLVVAGESIEHTSIGVRALLEHLDGAGPRTVPAIAEALELSRQFVQRSANDAVQAGLLEAAPNPQHRRSPLLRLTPTGHERIARITAREQALLARTGGDLTADEVAACRKVLTNVMATLVAVDASALPDGDTEHGHRRTG